MKTNSILSQAILAIVMLFGLIFSPFSVKPAGAQVPAGNLPPQVPEVAENYSGIFVPGDPGMLEEDWDRFEMSITVIDADTWSVKITPEDYYKEFLVAVGWEFERGKGGQWVTLKFTSPKSQYVLLHNLHNQCGKGVIEAISGPMTLSKQVFDRLCSAADMELTSKVELLEERRDWNPAWIKYRITFTPVNHSGDFYAWGRIVNIYGVEKWVNLGIVRKDGLVIDLWATFDVCSLPFTGSDKYKEDTLPSGQPYKVANLIHLPECPARLHVPQILRAP